MKSLRLAGLAFLAACAPAARPAPAAAQVADTSALDAIPPGLGTLRQDDLTVRLRTDALEIRFTPLDPRVMKLLSPDNYASLNGLVESRRRAIDSVAAGQGISRPGLALVTFFALQPNANFDAEVLNVSVRNRLVRPIGIVPYSPGFTEQRLEVRQQAMGLYVFEEPIPVFEPFVVQYYQSQSGEWERRLATIDRERQRVAARASQQGAGGAPPPR